MGQSIFGLIQALHPSPGTDTALTSPVLLVCSPNTELRFPLTFGLHFKIFAYPFSFPPELTLILFIFPLKSLLWSRNQLCGFQLPDFQGEIKQLSPSKGTLEG